MKKYQLSVWVGEWGDSQGNEIFGLPLNQEIIIHYTRKEAKQFDDLDQMVGEKLFEKYGAIAYSYIF